ncbi:hypothetical protein BDA96_02G343900 [Sorghum bicolor]|uniref:X8 domain-containing protein n=2 Tax=Sorghum bicolor TaxID=4558 RepID=A0A1B6QER6_SORBI|nr:glucan endo-1,3-beta-glucosidase 3-like [Sorghum bicolor]KAG0545231.1 hypothetical protein BDA96_02G343900 [Sorghum bicolor]KXG36403.1 hypothetical protein SORBI_3002G327900 [Sorghum bicolor]|eukprot:XP_021307883.1 glucan endo-1,3-beta-glucosidase 3-like [Sorghum bicolor]
MQHIMAFTRLLVVLLGAAFPLLLLFSPAVASELGVSYGRVANDLPDPSSVVKLLGDNGITMVRIYDANSNVLSSLANTGIKVMVMLPNENLADAASSSDKALQWVQNNVAAYYPATNIHGVAVGNEVFNSKPDQNLNLVPAMTNIQKALAQLNLADAIKVTTPIAFNAVAVSWPPSSGAFGDDIAQLVMKPMLQFLQQTGSYLSVNYYPYLTYMAQPDTFNLDYVLGNNPNPGAVDPDTQFKYNSLLDAQRDATYYAMDKLGASYSNMAVHHTEHGAPSGGSLRGGGGGHRRLLQAGGVATIANAQTYINNLMNRVLSGNTGTPHRPNADMNVYIFALFNEDQKGTGAGDVEQHFGLFYPNMQKVYEFDFRGGGVPPAPGAESWCVANASVGESWLQAALEYACGHGADCSAIQPGAACFEPDTVVAHASYAFNSYYQRNGRSNGTCDFNGAGYIVYQEPAGTCDPNASWCVANAEVGDARLQNALDYACGNGADCSAIQPGGQCFQPDTKPSHASYAFNSYYQHKGRASGTCDFSGAASVVYQQPKVGNCVLPSSG